MACPIAERASPGRNAAQCQWVGNATRQMGWKSDTALLAGCMRKAQDWQLKQLGRLMRAQALSLSTMLYADLESDRPILSTWVNQYHPRAHAIIRPLTTPTGQGGVHTRLTVCRNTLLQQARLRLPLQGVLIMADVDCWLPRSEVLRSAIVSLVAHNSPWDVLATNSMPWYRDIWALRSTALRLNYDCRFDKHDIARHGSCSSRKFVVDPTTPTFRVRSAFNGLAIYRGHALRDADQCVYKSQRMAAQGKREVCEHVPLHECLSDHNKTIGILPWLLVDCFDDGIPSGQNISRTFSDQSTGRISTPRS